MMLVGANPNIVGANAWCNRVTCVGAKLMKLIAAVVALGCIGAAPSGVARQLEDVLSAKWRDGEIRSERINSTGESEISLGLLPSGPQGTFTLVLSARLQQRLAAEPPSTLRVHVGAGLNVNPNVIRRPVLRFVLDPSAPRTTTIDVSERLRFLDLDPGTAIENASATISLVEFIQLLRAEVTTGQIFGLEFSLSLKQREALRDFGLQVLPPRR